MIRKIRETALPVGIIILAAGSSSRLGEPKQLLPFKDENLIRHAVKEALAINPAATLVVLGAEADRVRKEVEEFPIEIVLNKQYTEGMATSIRCGVKHFMKHYPHLDHLIIMLCDQPYVEAWLLQALINMKQAQQQSHSIVASFYNEDMGVPALFDHRVFSDLLKLEGDGGAKSLMRQYRDRVATVAFPLGNVDIDTKEAYQKWI